MDLLAWIGAAVAASAATKFVTAQILDMIEDIERRTNPPAPHRREERRRGPRRPSRRASIAPIREAAGQGRR